MALDERHRTSIYQALVPLAGEDAAAAMLSHFPARDVEEAVTREYLDRRLAELRGELLVETAGLSTEIERLRTEIAGQTNRLTVRVGILFAIASGAIALLY